MTKLIEHLWTVFTGLVLIVDGLVRVLTLGFVSTYFYNRVWSYRVSEIIKSFDDSEWDVMYLNAEQPSCMFVTGKKE